MRPKSFLFLLFILCCGTANAQSVYELNYYFDQGNGREDHKAFLYCNGDGTGFIRVKYFDKRANADVLVHMDMQEDYGIDKNNSKDYNRKVLRGINPHIIAGDTAFQFTADRYWFTVNPDSGYFEPAFVETSKDGNQYNGIYTKKVFIEMRDLTQEFVLQYFTEEDVFYKNIFEPKARGGNTTGGARLHLISVTNTEADDIGQTCAIDKKATYKTFSTIASVLQIPFDAKEISGADFSRKNVLDAVRSLNAGENDIVIFYYSGHGFSKKNDSHLFPFMDLRIHFKDQKLADAELNIEEVYNMVRSKKGKIKLVLSDCCNWNESYKPIVSPNVAGMRGSALRYNPANCQALFISHQPVSYLMTAASKGQVSAGTMSKGGFFTSQFRESLEKYIGVGFTDNFSWWDVVTGAQMATKKIAGEVSCPQPENEKIYKPCKQTPLFKKD